VVSENKGGTVGTIKLCPLNSSLLWDPSKVAFSCQKFGKMAL
jgi:hypothetical protein